MKNWQLWFIIACIYAAQNMDKYDAYMAQILFAVFAIIALIIDFVEKPK